MVWGMFGVKRQPTYLTMEVQEMLRRQIDEQAEAKRLWDENQAKLYELDVSLALNGTASPEVVSLIAKLMHRVDQLERNQKVV